MGVGSIQPKVLVIFIAILSVLSLAVVTAGPSNIIQNVHSKASQEHPTSGTSPIYLIKLVETGLRKGVTWNAYIGAQNTWPNNGTNYTTDTNEIDFVASPGDYSTFIWADGPYVTLSQMGFSVSNESYSVNVPFTALYPVSIQDTSLPKNVSIGFRLVNETLSYNNSVTSYTIFSRPVYNLSNATTHYVVNGTYKLLAGEVIDSSLEIFGNTGNITVNGGSVSLNLSSIFGRVDLSAKGLPYGVDWGFAIPSLPPYPGLQPVKTLYLPDGAIYLQPVAKGYYTSGLNVTVKAGGTVNASFVFQREYPVTIRASGLPKGFQFQIKGLPEMFEGTPLSYPFLYVGTNATFMLPNGSYNFSISIFQSGFYGIVNGSMYMFTITSYQISSPNFTVDGHSTTINVTFIVSKRTFTNPALVRAYWIIGILSALLAIMLVAAGFKKYRKQ